MFKSLIFLLTIKLNCITSLYIPAAETKIETAEEIQNALCTITTKEIEASANATITRQLKGVCTSNELNLKLDKLHTKILQEIDNIKYIFELNGFNMPDEVDLKSGSSDYDAYYNQTSNLVGYTKKVSNRVEEILLYNNTIHDFNEGRTFYFYWNIDNVHDLLLKSDMYKSSSDFQVLGHALCLQFYPNHLSKKYLGIQLKPSSHGFLKKHKIVILNQFESGSDMDSGVLYGLEMDNKMFVLPEKSLEVKGFVVENAILIKLEIFLDS